MVDYVSDPLEASLMESWNGIEDLIKNGAQERFGTGAQSIFARGIRGAYLQYMKKEITRRYGMDPF